ncbi:MAG: hypothetical protein MZV63_15105 [Marinilabiliales bacterium]|nr:hypothetical protein [Marinilabiliales bacterium]
MQLCWLLYASDFNDAIVPNGLETKNAWIDGTGNNLAYRLPGATNLLTITNGMLFAYTRRQRSTFAPARRARCSWARRTCATSRCGVARSAAR